MRCIGERFEQLDTRIGRMQRFYVGTSVGWVTVPTAICSFASGFFR